MAFFYLQFLTGFIADNSLSQRFLEFSIMTSPAAETILATPVTAASSVFPGDQDAIKQQFRTLAALWHPDHCSDPRDGCSRPSRCPARSSAASRFTRTHTEKTIITQTRTLRISPLSIRQTDQAEIILGQSTFAQLFYADFQDLAAWEARAIGQFRYADLAMQMQMQPFLPQIEMDEPTQDGGRLIVSKRMVRIFCSAICWKRPAPCLLCMRHGLVRAC